MMGFAAMGMEIVWFRHMTILLGGFRAVFSLLLTVAPSSESVRVHCYARLVERRIARPAHWLMAIQALFVAFTLLGLAMVGVATVDRAPGAARYVAAQVQGVPFALRLQFSDVWFNIRPMLLAVALPAVLMGFSFPLANAITQRAERVVGRRAGVLYLANTLGAVGGSLAAGFILLPWLGIQAAASVLTHDHGIRGGATVRRGGEKGSRRHDSACAGSLADGRCINRALAAAARRLRRDARASAARSKARRIVRLHEGLNEVISVTESPGTGRTIW